jgi:hypothetical protein
MSGLRRRAVIPLRCEELHETQIDLEPASFDGVLAAPLAGLHPIR